MKQLFRLRFSSHIKGRRFSAIEIWVVWLALQRAPHRLVVGSRFRKNVGILDLLGHGADYNLVTKVITVGRDLSEHTCLHELGHKVAYQYPSQSATWLDEIGVLNSSYAEMFAAYGMPNIMSSRRSFRRASKNKALSAKSEGRISEWPMALQRSTESMDFRLWANQPVAPDGFRYYLSKRSGVMKISEQALGIARELVDRGVESQGYCFVHRREFFAEMFAGYYRYIHTQTIPFFEELAKD